MKKEVIRVPIYNVILNIMYGTKEELDREILEYFNNTDRGINKSRAVVFTNTEYWGNVFILFNSESRIDEGVIVHESFHTLYHIYDQISESKISGDSEKDAYLIQWIYETINKTIKD